MHDVVFKIKWLRRFAPFLFFPKIENTWMRSIYFDKIVDRQTLQIFEFKFLIWFCKFESGFRNLRYVCGEFRTIDLTKRYFIFGWAWQRFFFQRIRFLIFEDWIISEIEKQSNIKHYQVINCKKRQDDSST